MINNCEAGDMTCHHAHYDVIVMVLLVAWHHQYIQLTWYCIHHSMGQVHRRSKSELTNGIPDSKIYGANVGPNWGCQDPGGPHVGHTNLANWDTIAHPHRWAMGCLLQATGLNLPTYSMTTLCKVVSAITSWTICHLRWHVMTFLFG